MLRFWECSLSFRKLFLLQVSTLKKSQFENVPVLKNCSSFRIFTLRKSQFENVQILGVQVYYYETTATGIYRIASRIEIWNTFMFRFWGCCISFRMYFQFKITILRTSQFENVPVSGCPLGRSASLGMFKFWEFEGIMKQQPGIGIVSRIGLFIHFNNVGIVTAVNPDCTRSECQVKAGSH